MEWNDYITDKNKKIIELDNDKKNQLKFILDTFLEAEQVDNFNKQLLVNWFNGQLVLTGNKQFVGMFDHVALYTSKIDLSKILSNICPSKEQIDKAIDLYLFKFRLLPSEEQNKTLPSKWIRENWNNYENKYPYNLIK